MDMFMICVCPYHNLIVFCKTPLDPLAANLMRFFRGDLSGLEGLDEMEALHLIGFIKEPLGFHHLLIRLIARAGEAAGKRIRYAEKTVEACASRFFFVHHIVDAMA